MKASSSQDSPAASPTYQKQPVKSCLSWPMTVEEYESVLNATQPAKENQMISKAFQKFDANGDGFLSKDELKQYYLQEIDADRSTIDKELSQLIDECDVDGDGKISYSEFVHFVISNCKKMSRIQSEGNTNLEDISSPPQCAKNVNCEQSKINASTDNKSSQSQGSLLSFTSLIEEKLGPLPQLRRPFGTEHLAEQNNKQPENEINYPLIYMHYAALGGLLACISYKVLRYFLGET